MPYFSVLRYLTDKRGLSIETGTETEALALVVFFVFIVYGPHIYPQYPVRDSNHGHYLSLTCNRPFSKMAAENLNKSKLKTNTSTRKSTLILVTLPSFSISGEITAEKM